MTDAQTEARTIARCVRGCATDDQYTELVERIATALEAKAAELAAANYAWRAMKDRAHAAEAAAQADYERRILSALEPAAPDSAETMLSDLLARIHRDGGHYEAEHGTKKAVADADAIIARIYAEEIISPEGRQEAWQREADYDALIEEAKDFTERMTSQPWACELIDRLVSALTRPAEQAVTDEMVERLAQHLAMDHVAIDDRAEYSWHSANEQWRQSWRRKARAALKAAMEAGR